MSERDWRKYADFQRPGHRRDCYISNMELVESSDIPYWFMTEYCIRIPLDQGLKIEYWPCSSTWVIVGNKRQKARSSDFESLYRYWYNRIAK